MKKTIIFAIAAMVMAACAPKNQECCSGSTNNFPAINQDGKVAIVAHRGFWNCEGAGFSENTIASLRCAQEAGLWGSEFDVQLTKDDVAVVNHNADIQGHKISEHTYAELCELTFPNGEHVSTIDEYLAQGAKYPTTVLVLELKAQATPEAEDKLVELCLASAKANGVYDPSKLIFITFSHYMSLLIAEKCPEFVNQYLNGDFCPSELEAEGINGIDYVQQLFDKHPFYVEEAHGHGMSVNVWTVNNAEGMKKYADMGVDAITTNEPLTAREVLGDKEFKL